MTNLPLITSSAEKQIIEILCVPELHILLGKNVTLFYFEVYNLCSGVVEKLLKEFERKVFSSKTLGKVFMDNYLKKVILVLFLRQLYCTFPKRLP